MDLHSLVSNGDSKNRKRIGRGNASGWGKTAAKGHKGQKARSGGGVAPWFEGGATPLYRRLPKFGFKSLKQIQKKNKFNLVSLTDLNKFNDGDTVDLTSLRAHGLAGSNKLRGGVKILATGDLSTKNLIIKVNAISSTAQAKIEELGGTIETL